MTKKPFKKILSCFETKSPKGINSPKMKTLELERCHN
jgi:hypothetical protein